MIIRLYSVPGNLLSEPITPVDLAEQTKGFGTFLSGIWASCVRYFPTVLLAIGILIAGILVARFALKLMQRGMNRTKVDLTVNKFLMSLAKVVLYTLVLIVVLTLLGIPTTSLITVIGTAGLAIGLALQGSLSNLAGGVIILINKPFRIGEFVEIGGVSGSVEAISILYTQLNTIDNKAVFIPNGQISNGSLTNHSRNQRRRVDLIIPISYEADAHLAIRTIEAVVTAHPGVLTDPAPLIRVNDYAHSAVEIAVRPWCLGSDFGNVRFDLLEQIRDALREQGIEIPYNRLDVIVQRMN